MDFENTVGRVFGFYGVDGLAFKLGRYVFEAVENEDDGYRSYLDTVRRASADGLIFRNRPLARVRVEDHDDYTGYKLVDVTDGYVWLEVGTNHDDEYYPSFVFHYSPKDPTRKTPSNRVLDTLYLSVFQKGTDVALDLIYQTLDDAFRRGHFAFVDQLLTDADLTQMNPQAAVGLLMASYPGRHKLMQRRLFRLRLKKYLTHSLGATRADHILGSLR